jgi:hypothetical protein
MRSSDNQSVIGLAQQRYAKSHRILANCGVGECRHWFFPAFRRAGSRPWRASPTAPRLRPSAACQRRAGSRREAVEAGCVKASFTSSILKGLTIASIFFRDKERVVFPQTANVGG